MTISAFGPQGGNITPMNNVQSYLPALIGATDNPAATYSTQEGSFYVIGALCFFNIVLVTTTMTKTTTSDVLRITLPITAATRAGAVWQGEGRTENSTVTANAGISEIASGNSYLTFRNNGTGIIASTVITYASTSPGIGTLTNTITFNAGGFYEYNAA